MSACAFIREHGSNWHEYTAHYAHTPQMNAPFTSHHVPCTPLERREHISHTSHAHAFTSHLHHTNTPLHHVYTCAFLCTSCAFVCLRVCTSSICV